MGSGDGDRALRLRLNRSMKPELLSSCITESGIVWDELAGSTIALSRLFLRNIEVTDLRNPIRVVVVGSGRAALSGSRNV